MDVGNNIPELAFAIDDHTSEGMLKQTAGSVVSFIDCLGVGVEKIGEPFRRRVGDPKGL